MKSEPDYSGWNLIPQAPSSYDIHLTCQVENLGSIFESLPKPFGIFDPTYKGRFVEVGSFDGKTYSNVWQFVKAGWHGIMVEPMEDNLKLLRHNLISAPRSDVIVVPVACADKEGVLPMFFEREGSRRALPNELQHQIQCRRLDDILFEHKWLPEFDMLVIDAEDAEQQVLKGFDLWYWRPRLAIIETHGWQREIIHEAFAKWYRIYSEDGLNTLFVRRDLA